MKLIFVHGWSVTHTNTYGELPKIIAEQAPEELNLDIEHVYLGQYISFKDEVRISDIVVAFDHAIRDVLKEHETFSCITHSTGGPVIREWINTYFGKDGLASMPLQHLIMLAPANHGSALAQLGKKRVGRIKAWMDGVEPGKGVLDWLELGSSEQWQLNTKWLEYPESDTFFPFVITGQDIDAKLYDYINSYTAEKGSDGVIRCTAANLNYRKVTLLQDLETVIDYKTPDGFEGKAASLILEEPPKTPTYSVAFEVLPGTSHSQKRKGIIGSVTKRNQHKKQVVSSILDCLKVNSIPSYRQLESEMAQRTKKVQSVGKKHTYSMVVFKVVDNKGNDITDYDLYILADKDYQPDKLPRGFFVDKQKNNVNNCHLTYYFDQTVLSQIVQKRNNRIGFRVVPRPHEGFAYYVTGEFRSEGMPFYDLLKDNETLMVEIKLQREVDKSAFVLSNASEGHVNFKRVEPSGVVYNVD